MLYRIFVYSFNLWITYNDIFSEEMEKTLQTWNDWQLFASAFQNVLILPVVYANACLATFSMTFNKKIASLLRRWILSHFCFSWHSIDLMINNEVTYSSFNEDNFSLTIYLLNVWWYFLIIFSCYFYSKIHVLCYFPQFKILCPYQDRLNMRLWVGKIYVDAEHLPFWGKMVNERRFLILTKSSFLFIHLSNQLIHWTLTVYQALLWISYGSCSNEVNNLMGDG